MGLFWSWPWIRFWSSNPELVPPGHLSTLLSSSGAPLSRSAAWHRQSYLFVVFQLQFAGGIEFKEAGQGGADGFGFTVMQRRAWMAREKRRRARTAGHVGGSEQNLHTFITRRPGGPEQRVWGGCTVWTRWKGFYLNGCCIWIIFHHSRKK